MASELQYYGKLSESGLTIIARVYDSEGNQIGGDISATEAGTLAIYKADMPSAPFGIYGVRFFDGATLLGQGEIYWNGEAEEFPVASPDLEQIQSFAEKAAYHAEQANIKFNIED